ncbi:MAG TPA: zf-TFIIB domain-containing protein [Candidatus Koribacter sp.]|jgi:Zn-finger nucleic acid-binding protein
MPAAETLHCPNCGAAVSSDSAKCQFCGAVLATVACPKCFGMMFIGEKFCSHCGALAQRTETGQASLQCPRCKRDMNSVALGKTSLLECPNCQGMWLDVETLQLICAEKEQQAAVLGMPTGKLDPPTFETSFHYIPCPVCRQIMNRFNFAQLSGVIVDVCKAHGTWFDKDELRRVIEFIRAGGMDRARARQIAQEADQRARLASSANAGIPNSIEITAANAEFPTSEFPTAAIRTLASFIGDLFK